MRRQRRLRVPALLLTLALALTPPAAALDYARISSETPPSESHRVTLEIADMRFSGTLRRSGDYSDLDKEMAIDHALAAMGKSREQLAAAEQAVEDGAGTWTVTDAEARDIALNIAKVAGVENEAKLGLQLYDLITGAADLPTAAPDVVKLANEASAGKFDDFMKTTVPGFTPLDLAKTVSGKAAVVVLIGEQMAADKAKWALRAAALEGQQLVDEVCRRATQELRALDWQAYDWGDYTWKLTVQGSDRTTTTFFNVSGIPQIWTLDLRLYKEANPYVSDDSGPGGDYRGNLIIDISHELGEFDRRFTQLPEILRRMAPALVFCKTLKHEIVRPTQIQRTLHTNELELYLDGVALAEQSGPARLSFSLAGMDGELQSSMAHRYTLALEADYGPIAQLSADLFYDYTMDNAPSITHTLSGSADFASELIGYDIRNASGQEQKVLWDDTIWKRLASDPVLIIG